MDFRALLDEKRKEKEEFEALVSSKGWENLSRILRAGMDMRRVEAIQPSRSIDEAFSRSVVAAELAGMELASRMPYMYIEELDRDIKGLLNQIEGNEDEQ